MRKKNVLVIILTALLFLSATVLGVSTVYRVDDVMLNAPVVSEEAKTEAQELQKKLSAAYKKQSTMFADDKTAKKIIAEFPYFQLVSFKKSYPDRIVVEVREDAEVYAVAANKEATSYYVLSANGTVLGVRAQPQNRSDGMANVLIGGIDVTGEKGGKLTGDESLSYLFEFTNTVFEKLGGIRRNITSITVSRPASDSRQTMFTLTTYEGVKVYVRNPAENVVEKAEKAIDAYLSLSDRERLTGMLVVWDGTDGVKTQYSARNVPIE